MGAKDTGRQSWEAKQGDKITFWATLTLLNYWEAKLGGKTIFGDDTYFLTL